jgi:8-oxo-dGTP diphosphatase
MDLGADAVVVSPVLDTGAHPNSPAIGWEGLRRISARASLPVYAQGGLDGSLVESAQRAGAIGIASARWSAALPARSMSVV